MKLIKTAAAVLNQTPFDWDNNKANILDAIAEAQAQKVSILCLPELCITGYGCEDDFFRTDLRERAWSILTEILPATKGMIVSLGLPVLYNNALFNCAAMVIDGEIRGLVAKQNLAGDGIHYEPRWFEAWAENTVAEVEIGAGVLPIGDMYFCIGGVKIGFEICEDAWVGNRPGARLAARAVDIILNPSASHFSFGKLEIRKRLVLEGSRSFSASYIYSNLLGNEAGRAIYDGGAIIASAGKLLAVGPRFSFADYNLTVAVVDVDQTRMNQSRTYSFRPDISGEDGNCIHVDFAFPELLPACLPADCRQQPFESSPFIKEEELSRSIALGLYDYLRKTRSSGYVVSLSGGADSTAVCCLVSLMIELGIADIGLAAFKRKLPHLPFLANLADRKELLAKLLTCAYQGTKNSSQSTRNSARTVAEALGARYFEFDIEEAVNLYTSMVSGAIGRELDWQTDDIALQNIQARVRNPSIWLLANIYGAILLCTSNRSEGAVGYCTMDGDTSGGLSPIAGVDKAFIRHWLSWLQKEGPQGLHPYPALSAVIEQTPGPELRPLSMAQSAENDLMPYDVLDAIEESSIENNQSPRDCYLLMRARFPSYEPAQMAAWVEKFFLLWSRNQWKRERLAPALHVASRNLDPRTWRRSPILSGGFKCEIAAMWQAAHKENTGGKEAAKEPFHSEGSVLVVVDPQKGFGSRGQLPVPDAEAIVPVINSLLTVFPRAVATQDWHPPDHVSFAASHKGKKPGDVLDIDGIKQPLFAAHCLAETDGASFLDGLDPASFERIFRKGTDSKVDAFSAFLDNAGNKATDIEAFLKEIKAARIYVCGLATNYCVESTARHARQAGFEVYVIADACRGIDSPQGAIAESLARMEAAGITVLSSADLSSRQAAVSAGQVV